MSRPHRRGRDRASYTDEHWFHLATGHDFFGGGWGLDALPDADLRAAIEEMLECWQLHEHDVRAMRPDPWFAPYANNPATLFAEFRQQREWMEFQRVHGGYSPGLRDLFDHQAKAAHPALFADTQTLGEVK